MKYAFIMNSRTLNPDIYSKYHEDRKNQYYFAAVHGMIMTRELAKKLTGDGYDFIDLCGDYNAEKTQEIRKATDGKIKVNYAKYSEQELAKFDTLPANNRYGIIVLGFDMRDERIRLVLESSEYNTYIDIVDSEETAGKVAEDMVAEGIHFIELCGYFNSARAEKIKKAVDFKLPVGYCGI